MMGKPEDGKGNRRERRKVLPQVTNVSRLWRLLAGSMVRRRKEDTGEPIVERTLKVIHVPMGTEQQKLYKHWLQTSVFERFFTWKFPGHPLVEAGLVERFAAGIGQLQKLEYATTIPESDPERDWPGQLPGVTLTNYTPKNMKVLELAIQHAEAGEKVLIGSCLIDTGLWLSERLREAGINAVHITEEQGGKAQTMNPKKRAKVMHEFRHGSAQVLCCGIQAIRLGHNLDTASVVIVNGLVYSYENLDQFLARAHRLTSKKPVTVYMPQIPDTTDTAKWDLLTAKGAAADLALDGQLAAERTDPVALEKVLRDLKAQGARMSADNTIDEASLEAAWLERIARTQPLAKQPEARIIRIPRPRTEPVPIDTDAPQLSLFG
jgi:SNF2 family DNA or RNA helicase